MGGVAVVSLGAAFWDELFGSAQRRPLRRGPGYGPLRPPDENGVRLATGFRSRLVVRGGEPVSDTGYEWHIASDGMAAFRLDDGGFVLVSNSENFKGGASALRFGSGGQVEDAYSILSGTTQNCSGGGTPWYLALVRGGRGRPRLGMRPIRPTEGGSAPGHGHLQT